MQQLDALTREASALGAGEYAAVDARAAEQEVARVMQICNACRYCEGFCAVFPAMTRRLEFNRSDVHLLANLCHNCSACLHACQYAPPHEFAVNVPRAMAQVRAHTYREYAWPAALGSLYARGGLAVALATAGSLAVFLMLAIALTGGLNAQPGEANFYAVFPHNLLAVLFGLVLLFVCGVFGVGVARFWREGEAHPVEAGAIGEAVHDVLSLRYLGGGHGEGCNNESDAFTLARRRFHHLTFYGFMLCFAATCVATGYHYLLGYEAPYPLFSVPVVLGTLGGLGLLVGPAGLLWLNLRRNPLQTDPGQKPMDRGFIALLLLVAGSGLLLLALREQASMPFWLALHLGCVMGLFLTMPYGKFAHGIYRSAALLKWAVEKRRPARLKLGGD